MKAKTPKKAFSFILSLLCVSFFAACSNEITEPALTSAEPVMNQRSAVKKTLSEMTEQECLEFIVKNGVAIPERFADIPEFGAFVKRLIHDVELNPNYTIGFHNIEMVNLYEGITAAVNDYYGASSGILNQSTPQSAYTLQYNLVMNSSGDWVNSGGAWDASYQNYHCYYYAIEKPYLFINQQGELLWEPGHFSGVGENGYKASAMALSVQADLLYFGHGDAYVTNIAPNPATLAPHQKMVCIREGIFGDPADPIYWTDYHLMKYNADDGYWYHKPGRTIPLRYLYHPSYGEWNSARSEYVWRVELSGGGESLENGYYFGDIYYIVYNEYGGGDGTLNNPYQIKNVGQLQKIHKFDSSTTYFKLMKNIDLSDTYRVPTAQMPLPHFWGHFDGNGKTISNLSGYTPLTYGGGFGLFEANSGTIKNLHVTGYIGVTNETSTGMIAGINHGFIKNCTSQSNQSNNSNGMIFVTQSTNSYVGGITGYNTGTVQDCINYSNVQGMNHAGGVVGYNTSYGTVLRSYNTGNIQSRRNTGGVVGYNSYGTVSHSYNTGEVSSNYENCGGIVGQNLYGAVANSYNTGKVYGGINTGGIVGLDSSGTVANSYNTGIVYGSNNTGGIVGSSSNVVNNCVSLGREVSGTAYIVRVANGGGYLSSNRSRANMIVTASGNPVPITSNLNGIHGLDTPYNTALSTVFSGWDNSVWSIPGSNLSVNGALPTLLNMPLGVQNPVLVP
jgi:hypothetical protein